MAGSSSELQGDILWVCGLLCGACLRGRAVCVFILSGFTGVHIRSRRRWGYVCRPVNWAGLG
jgi:hypothetical protein